MLLLLLTILYCRAALATWLTTQQNNKYEN